MTSSRVYTERICSFPLVTDLPLLSGAFVAREVRWVDLKSEDVSSGPVHTPDPHMKRQE